MRAAIARPPRLAAAWLVVCASGTCAISPGCGRHDAAPAQQPALQIVGESTRRRTIDPVPQTTLWFDGARVSLLAARGETLGLQVLHRGGGPVALTLRAPSSAPAGSGGASSVQVRGYAVELLEVRRPSTEMYGGSHGPGVYAEGLSPAAVPTTDPAYFELEVARDAPAGVVEGELTVGGRSVPVALTIAPVTLPPMPLRVWAYEDPWESRWAGSSERDCAALFRAYGVLLFPDVRLEDWPARRAEVTGLRDLPVWISDDPGRAAEQVKAWIAATAGTEHLPFAIPIDEPRTPELRRRVRALADAVRAAGGGPTRFRYAVPAAPHPDLGDSIDLYIAPGAVHLAGDRVARWTYNGAPPYAGSMVLDAEPPGMRTWGWIAWRWQVPIWYVWDGLYWHDRHNRKQTPLSSRKLDLRDPISFDDGEDRGNLDGVLALPGCQPTLRMAALRRGYQDHQLLELAAACNKPAADQVAADLVPRALGDAGSKPSWPSDEAPWEAARRRLIALASCGAR
ncbi:MAG TPA: hypothetical protein VGD80_02185 [Kofleriaceae bacterium]